MALSSTGLFFLILLVPMVLTMVLPKSMMKPDPQEEDPNEDLEVPMSKEDFIFDFLKKLLGKNHPGVLATLDCIQNEAYERRRFLTELKEIFLPKTRKARFL